MLPEWDIMIGWYSRFVVGNACHVLLHCIKRYQKTDTLIPCDGITTENVNGSTMPVVKPCVSHCQLASSRTESTKTSSNVVDPIYLGSTSVGGILPTSAIQDVTDQIGGHFTHQFVKASQFETYETTSDTRRPVDPTAVCNFANVFEMGSRDGKREALYWKPEVSSRAG
ncbi:hypothetical protein MHU86_14211 [Fragilaria crotonensis]|nr:hypothetical protein MHU86_14211 [Fragilaria crotonensis]